MVELLKYSNFCKIILEIMSGIVVISKVHALMYVVLSRAEKHVSYGELVGTG
jgi:hypothetical protein